MKCSNRLKGHRGMLCVAMLGAAALSGCASVPDATCASVDWYALGVDDGTDGRSLDYLASHDNQCVAGAAEADLDAYRAGRLAGLADYCTMESGLELARSGARYAGVCPVEVEGDFLTGFRLGRHIHRVEVEMANNRGQAEQIEQALDSTDLANVERQDMRSQLDLLEQDYDGLEVRMERLAWEAGMME